MTIKRLITIILLFVIFSISIFMIFTEKKKYDYININDKITKEIIIDTNIEEKNNKIILDRYRKEYNNQEIIGIIRIENTDFSMLFAKSNDNDYYLNHLINKEYNKLGATFLDYRNDIDNDKKINIYGHNNGKIGLSFNYITQYKDKEFYDNHKNIIISSNIQDYHYEIFSIQIIDNNYIHMKLHFNNDEEWHNYLNDILEKSLYKENININNINKVLTLQTCTNRKDGEFLLVNARLI